jgi:basic membrane lipoprotein Med (substrate-binding protein (PBP1-ABC) superfamily)
MKKLQNLSDVNTNTQEGRYLMAALAKLTTESQTVER